MMCPTLWMGNAELYAVGPVQTGPCEGRLIIAGFSAATRRTSDYVELNFLSERSVRHRVRLCSRRRTSTLRIGIRRFPGLLGCRDHAGALGHVSPN